MKTGFTLVELLIALALSGLIFVMASSLMVTLLATQTKSRKLETFDQTKNDLYVDLYHTLKWSKSITFQDHGQIDELTADTTLYRLQDGRLLKNDVPLTSQNIIVSAFDIASYSTTPDYSSLAITISLQDNNFNLSQDTLKVVVSQRQTEISQSP